MLDEQDIHIEPESTQSEKRLGFDKSGSPYKGVHPESGERHAVVLGEMKREFGPKRGEEIYRAVGAITGVIPATAGANYEPDIQLIGLDADTRAKVDAILAGKE